MLSQKTLLELVILCLAVCCCYGKTPRGDTVPFMLLVQHQSGYRCAGALVSLRVAVSTASCARMRSGAITVLTGAFLSGALTEKEGVRRIKSIVLPVGYKPSLEFDGSVNDVAVMRLEKAFAGGSKIIRPILMEKDQTNYEREGTMCNLVRIIQAPIRNRRDEDSNHNDEMAEAIRTPRDLNFTSSTDWRFRDKRYSDALNEAEEVNLSSHGQSEAPLSLPIVVAGSDNLENIKDITHNITKRAIDDGKYATIFRIFDVTVLNPERCRSDNVIVGNHYWTPLSKQVMCTQGAAFCQSDWGTGLVCEGKLCGLLSRVARAAGQPGCGTTHTLQSLGRWKRFLECAHDVGKCQQPPCSKTCEDIQLELDSKYSDSSEDRNNKKDEDIYRRNNIHIKVKTTESTKKQKPTTNKKITTIQTRRTLPQIKNELVETDKVRVSSSESDDSGLEIELKPNEKGMKVNVKSDDDESDKFDSGDVSDNGDAKTSAPESIEDNDVGGSGANLNLENEEKHAPTKRTTKTVTAKPKTTMSNRIPTRTKKPLPLSSSSNHMLDFEPYRPDFKLGDYEDSGPEYRSGGGFGFEEGEDPSRGKIATTNKHVDIFTSTSPLATSADSWSVEQNVTISAESQTYGILPEIRMVKTSSSGAIVHTIGFVLEITVISVLYLLQRS